MTFKDKELIIFDFDGTLINSIPDLALAVNKMLAHYDLAPLSVEQVTPLVGNGAKPLVQRSLEHSSRGKEIVQTHFDEACELYFEAYGKEPCKDTFAYPGVVDTLDYLHKKGYKMSICTNKPYAFIAPILEALAIKSYFNSWIGEDSIAEKKPSAGPLLHLAKAMDISLTKSIMIGDSKNDILAAQNAGMDNIGVSYGYNYNENIADYKPTLVVDQFADLQELF